MHSNMIKDYGEPMRYDPDFYGPAKNRSCTDVFWLLVFAVFCGGWIYIGVYGIQHGNAVRLLAPVDTQGHRCGLDAGYQDKPYLVFFDIIKCADPTVAFTGCPTQQVCVEQCPDQSVIFAQETNPASSTFSRLVCQYHVNKNTVNSYADMMALISRGDCASYVLQSQPVAQRCVPDLYSAEIGDLLQQIQANVDVGAIYDGISIIADMKELATMIVEDLVMARYYMLGAVAAVVLLCFLYILLLRWAVAPLVWISLLGLLALISFGTYRCYENYVNFTPGLSTGNNVFGLIEGLFQSKTTWLVLTILLAITTVVLFLVIVFLRKRVVIACALIKEASKAVTANMTTVFYPLLPFLVQCAVVVFAVISLVFLLSVGASNFVVARLNNDTDCSCTSYVEGVACTPEEFLAQCFRTGTNNPCNVATCHFTGIETEGYIKAMIVAVVFGFFWLIFFVEGMSNLTLAGTFSQWYWTFHKSDLPFFTLTRGAYRAVRYHMGTVALGSMIIAIVRLIRVGLEYIDRKLKKYDNGLVKGILCMCKCCFYILETFLKFINKNAYIMCAVHGGSFCTSARDAFNLLMRNIVRVFVLDKVTDFLFLASKLLIAGGTGAAVYYLAEWNYLYSELGATRLHYNVVPAVVLAVVAYFVAMLFFNVYAVAVDTLFLCFFEDCERNDGSPERPYYMSKNLMKILGKRNKIQ